MWALGDMWALGAPLSMDDTHVNVRTNVLFPCMKLFDVHCYPTCTCACAWQGRVIRSGE